MNKINLFILSLSIITSFCPSQVIVAQDINFFNFRTNRLINNPAWFDEENKFSTFLSFKSQALVLKEDGLNTFVLSGSYTPLIQNKKDEAKLYLNFSSLFLVDNQRDDFANIGGVGSMAIKWISKNKELELSAGVRGGRTATSPDIRRFTFGSQISQDLNNSESPFDASLENYVQYPFGGGIAVNWNSDDRKVKEIQWGIAYNQTLIRLNSDDFGIRDRLQKLSSFGEVKFNKNSTLHHIPYYWLQHRVRNNTFFLRMGYDLEFNLEKNPSKPDSKFRDWKMFSVGLGYDYVEGLKFHQGNGIVSLRAQYKSIEGSVNMAYGNENVSIEFGIRCNFRRLNCETDTNCPDSVEIKKRVVNFTENGAHGLKKILRKIRRCFRDTLLIGCHFSAPSNINEIIRKKILKKILCSKKNTGIPIDLIKIVKLDIVNKSTNVAVKPLKNNVMVVLIMPMKNFDKQMNPVIETLLEKFDNTDYQDDTFIIKLTPLETN